jgi:copper chaperone CopZ
MNKYVLGIDGMGCGSCEAHVKDVIRRNFQYKKVIASHIKNQLIVFTESNLGENDFKMVLDPTGYRVTSFERLPAIHKWYGWR